MADPVDVEATVHVDEKAGLSKMQWVSVVGVGTVLIVGIVPWMMYLINSGQKMFETTIQHNTVAITAATEQSRDVEQAIEANTRMLGRLRDKIGDEEP